jgi:glycosyltransferase involved in cell wall biosynthesis
VTATLTATAPAGADIGAPRVSIVLPAYNEEARLPSSLERVIAWCGDQAFDSEIVVSDDGSMDATASIVRERCDGKLPGNVRLRLLQSPRNEGKGAAIRRGCLDARGAYVVFMDADLATPPEEASKLLAQLDGGADVAIGSRIQPDGSDMRASQPRQRQIAGKLFTIVRKTLRILPELDDTQCPLKGFRIDVARAVFPRQRLRGWVFDAEVLFIARSLGYGIVSAPVRWRHVEGSRVRLRPSQAFEVMRDLLRLRFSRN